MKPQRFLRKKTKEKTTQILKETYDPFANFEGSKFELYIAKTFYYIRNNWKLFSTVILIFLLIFITLIFYKIYQNNLEKKALLEYEELEKNPVMKPGAADLKVAVEKLDKYIEKYPIESARKRAIIKKIQLYEFNKEYEKAAEHYEELAKIIKYPDLKINFYYRAAIHFENIQKYSRSLTNIEEIQKYPINNSLINANLYYTQLRLLYKLGKKEDAKRLAKKIIELDDTENPEIKNIKSRVIVYFLFNK